MTGLPGAATGSSSSPSTGTSTDTTGHHGQDTALTGTTAAKVKAAALATYPGATIVRIDTGSNGLCEAHITTTAGTNLTVQIGKSFAVTGTPAGEGHGQH